MQVNYQPTFSIDSSLTLEENLQDFRTYVKAFKPTQENLFAHYCDFMILYRWFGNEEYLIMAEEVKSYRYIDYFKTGQYSLCKH